MSNAQHVLLKRPLPDTHQARTHEFNIAGYEGYIVVGLYEDESPGEIFIVMSKEGPTIGGLLDTIAILVSTALQYGLPIEVITERIIGQCFEPSGFTANPDIRSAKSITDYIFRWLRREFVLEAKKK